MLFGCFLDCGDGVLEDQKLTLRRKEKDLIRVVAFDGSSNWLASGYQANNDLLASERRDEL